MRIIPGLAITLLIFSLLVSCAVFDVSYSKKPEKVAEKFLNLFYKGDYEKAKKYGTSHTRQIIDMMDQIIAVSGKNPFQLETKVKMLDSEIKGDTARCNYFANNVKNELLLIKTDDRWLVDMKKETPAKEGSKNLFKQYEKPNENNK